MRVTAHLNNVRISPYKVRRVSTLIKGLGTADALAHLEQDVRRASVMLYKVIASAVANAENNFGLDKNNLYVYDVRIGDRPTLKRWMPRAFGRATPILKRTAKISITLEEKEEGKNRLSQKDLEKTRKEQQKHTTKSESAKTEKIEEIRESGVILPKEKGGESHKAEHRKVETERRQSRQSGWAQKMFRRKSD